MIGAPEQTSKVFLNLTADSQFLTSHKSVVEQEIEKEIQYMKDLIMSQIYCSDTECLNFSLASPEFYDEIFFSALRDMLSNQEIKIKHILCANNQAIKITK